MSDASSKICNKMPGEPNLVIF